MEPLVAAALIGTSRRGTADVTVGAPVDGLVAGGASREVERRILLRAGARAVYQMAGALPMREVAAMELAPEERLPACSATAAELVRSFLFEPHSALLPEALERLRLAGLRLPFDMLPLALSARDNQRALAHVVGERGRWLSRFNPAWSWVRSLAEGGSEELPDDAETVWQEGSASERVDMLRRMRATDPARAREWVLAVWPRESAEMRANLLATFADSLALADEAFLEAALTDRAEAVRNQAEALLASLPDSAWARALMERADELVTYAGGKLTVTLPREAVTPGSRDGLHETPLATTGVRSLWIALCLSRVPLRHWNERFGATAEELVAGTDRSDWKWPLLDGWSRAFLFSGGGSWIVPLWLAWSAPSTRHAQYHLVRRSGICRELAPHVPPRELERLAVAMFERQRHDVPLTLSEIAEVLPRPWHADFGNAYLDGLRQFLAALPSEPNNVESWGATLESAALALPSECFMAALKPFAVSEGAGSHLEQFSRKLEKFIGVLRLRQRLMEAIPL